ncbi:Cell division cycle-associated protein 7 [Merluccius polli]|uniref:Cell division cycle-associated protein 7 n=1 Tax=Merluccius polli TaxID=89951 RepID=A0AA47NSR4_MERPO|nr:Cell division cycle-associated protein 7 [Merluccius polli]
MVEHPKSLRVHIPSARTSTLLLLRSLWATAGLCIPDHEPLAAVSALPGSQEAGDPGVLHQWQLVNFSLRGELVLVACGKHFDRHHRALVFAPPHCRKVTASHSLTGEGLSTMVRPLPKPLADMFAEESEDDDHTFHGFPEHEIGDLYTQLCPCFADLDICGHQNASYEDMLEAAVADDPPQGDSKAASSKGSGGAHRFTLRVALRLRSRTPRSSEEDGEVRLDDETEVKEEPAAAAAMMMVKEEETTPPPRKKRRVKFEEEEKAIASLPVQRDSDSEGDTADTFLSKREMNVKANKAMLAQLMADLQKMPGGEGILKKHTKAKKAKERGAQPPRSGGGGESRRNPERATRRQTRSMGGCEDPSDPRDAALELSLEDELLEVRHAPRRGTPRPNPTKPHVVRPVEDITEDELRLVADQMTEKVYNRVTGSTCHQCRQKTVDTKTCCRSDECRGIQGQFCGPCLRNRYGEDVKKALLDPEWQCPPCRGICNCSFCRQREGRCPTGILFPLAQYHGFSDVHSYLSSLRHKLKSGEEDEDL